MQLEIKISIIFPTNEKRRTTASYPGVDLRILVTVDNFGPPTNSDRVIGGSLLKISTIRRSLL